MQTFLPYPDFQKSLEILDYKRLGKQRVEAKIILDILVGNTRNSRWRNHPAVLMWRTYDIALTLYYNISIIEWTKRGYKNNMQTLKIPNSHNIIMPYWFGHKEFHLAHQSNLLRKNYQYYIKYFKATNQLPIPTDMPYYWPKPLIA